MDKEKIVSKEDVLVIVSCSCCDYYILDTSDNTKYCSSSDGCPPMEGELLINV